MGDVLAERQRVAERLAASVLGRAVRATPVRSIMPDRTQVFVLNDREAVLKLYGTERKCLKESIALNLLSDSGLPVPSVIESGHSDGAPWWVLMTFVPGTPLHDADASRIPAHVYRTLGTQIGRLHAHAVYPAFGSWPGESDGFPTLPDRVIPRARREVKKALETVRPDDEQQLLYRAARQLRASEAAVLQAYRLRPRHLHRDLNSRNVLVTDDWQVTGIIDFERSEPGDPAEDFARLALYDAAWRPDFHREFFSGYRTATELDEGAIARVQFHVLALVFEIANWAPGVDDDYYQAALAAARGVLDGRPPIPTLTEIGTAD